MSQAPQEKEGIRQALYVSIEPSQLAIQMFLALGYIPIWMVHIGVFLQIVIRKSSLHIHLSDPISSCFAQNLELFHFVYHSSHFISKYLYNTK